jgi:hypothetical protein
MDIQKAFKEWYRTEGIRTFPQKGEHFHEFFTETAFKAGVEAMVLHYEKQLEEQEKRIFALKRLIRRLNK